MWPSETLWCQLNRGDIWTLTSFSRSKSRSPELFWQCCPIHKGYQHTKIGYYHWIFPCPRFRPIFDLGILVNVKQKYKFCPGTLRFFKRNANAFSLRLSSMSASVAKWFFGISQKLLKLAISKFNTAASSTGFTFSPEMTSPATSGRQQIPKTYSF